MKRVKDEPADPMRIISEADLKRWVRVNKLELLTADEAAFWFRRGLSTFEGMVKDGPIPFCRPTGPNGDRLFLKSDLVAYVNSRRENQPAA